VVRGFAAALALPQAQHAAPLRVLSQDIVDTEGGSESPSG
jgi:hypothetical protein